jgi:hypothetical protein
MAEVALHTSQPGWERMRTVVPGVVGFHLELTEQVRLEVLECGGDWFPTVIFGRHESCHANGLASAAAAEQWAWREVARLHDELSKALGEPYQPLSEVEL